MQVTLNTALQVAVKDGNAQQFPTIQYGQYSEWKSVTPTNVIDFYVSVGMWMGVNSLCIHNSLKKMSVECKSCRMIWGPLKSAVQTMQDETYSEV